MNIKSQVLDLPQGLLLRSGAQLGAVRLAYETYGVLNAERSNAILICHALSGSAHVAGKYDEHEPKSGWWDSAVGPGRVFDTNRYFVICTNVLGGCSGSTGPASLNPATGKPYGLSFPVVTIADMVEAQRHLLDALGIQSLLCVTGGSMGGMQALQWTVSYPERVQGAIILASTAQVSAQAIALNEVARQAIYADPHWNAGDYYGGTSPSTGLALARMIGHITYLSETSMRQKFGRRLQDRMGYGYQFAAEFQVESYLKYQGDRFTERFDANCLLYMTKAIDYFDLADGHAHLAAALARIRAKVLVLSYSSDWLFPPDQSKDLVRALLQSGVDATYIGIQSDYGHDAFLLEVDRLGAVAGDFLNGVVSANRPRQAAPFVGALRGARVAPLPVEQRIRLAS
jgi:homoserine O-acetyltransferase